ncbi:MAG TPA: sigma-54 dependent transcriptional regulator [Candidatus Krumholzibacteria bacterium]|nr:sigma-54 dependent transcriptional regulator [Candidatus Krumholzibacteria bacterium]HRX50937.1 sigma-54 dependent transcriptional regulator [Candidatus Krumholzibacteria bacterium]
MERNLLVLLGRNPSLYKIMADWALEDVDLYVHDDPSEALAHLSDGQAALFVFDTSGFGRTSHVVDTFLNLKGDADLIILGDPAVMSDVQDRPHRGIIRRLDLTATPEELRSLVERLLRLRTIRQRSGIVGRSPAVNQMISLIAQAAPLDVNVLIQGESGTGKELVARAIHAHSSRRDGPFLSVNCGALSEGVLESELFGHARGAFTGAVQRHEGVFQRADGGTLFLDEVGEMPLGMQTRFLRALETGEFTPVGGTETLRSDIRLVAATHRDLAADVDRGRFRQDLFYRLRVVVIPTPPLRERTVDIPVLVRTFLDQENARHGLHVRGLSRPALDVLSRYRWPGNIRELRNVVSSLVVLKQEGMIEADDLPAEIVDAVAKTGSSPHVPVPLNFELHEQMEKELVARTLWELRNDVKEIKALLLGGRGTAGRMVPAWTDGDAGRVVDTYAGDLGYSTEPASDGGDLQSAERTLIEAALRATGGRRRQAAERLGISERTLYRKLNKYGLS